MTKYPLRISYTAIKSGSLPECIPGTDGRGCGGCRGCIVRYSEGREVGVLPGKANGRHFNSPGPLDGLFSTHNDLMNERSTVISLGPFVSSSQRGKSSLSLNTRSVLSIIARIALIL